METSTDGYIIALDVGERRTGVAIAHALAAIPSPLTTLVNDANFWANLEHVIKDNQVIALVLGLPRGMAGQDTAQTSYVRQFARDLKKHTNLPTYWQDESVTSVQAEDELRAGGKGYNKSMIDAQAAAIILQDFLQGRERHNV